MRPESWRRRSLRVGGRGEIMPNNWEMQVLSEARIFDRVEPES